MYQNKIILKIFFLKRKKIIDEKIGSPPESDLLLLLEQVMQIFFENKLYEATEQDKIMLEDEIPFQSAFRLSKSSSHSSYSSA